MNRAFRGTAPAGVIRLLSRTGEGKVALVNRRGAYLALSGEMLLFCDARWGAVPCGAALEEFEAFRDLLSPETPFSVSGRILIFSSGEAELDLAEAEPDGTAAFPDERAFSRLYAALKNGANPEGLSVLGPALFEGKEAGEDPWRRRALPLMLALLSALDRPDPAAVRRAASGLLGLGPGLTPSGDDVLAGLYYGLSHSPRRKDAGVLALGEALSGAGACTSPVSASFLRAVAAGAPFDLLKNAWRNPAGASALLQAGAHSGGEMLLGLLCAASLAPR